MGALEIAGEASRGLMQGVKEGMQTANVYQTARHQEMQTAITAEQLEKTKREMAYENEWVDVSKGLGSMTPSQQKFLTDTFDVSRPDGGKFMKKGPNGEIFAQRWYIGHAMNKLGMDQQMQKTLLKYGLDDYKGSMDNLDQQIKVLEEQGYRSSKSVGGIQVKPTLPDGKAAKTDPKFDQLVAQRDAVKGNYDRYLKQSILMDEKAGSAVLMQEYENRKTTAAVDKMMSDPNLSSRVPIQMKQALEIAKGTGDEKLVRDLLNAYVKNTLTAKEWTPPMYDKGLGFYQINKVDGKIQMLNREKVNVGVRVDTSGRVKESFTTASGKMAYLDNSGKAFYAGSQEEVPEEELSGVNKVAAPKTPKAASRFGGTGTGAPSTSGAGSYIKSKVSK